MGLTERRQRLLGTDRWRALGVFVERWYAQPLSDGDGHSALEIEQVARRLGTPLPAALTEWYELVGKRLRCVQDYPRLLHELTVEDGALRVWTENQGVWSIVAPLDAGDDPVCKAREDLTGSLDAPLSQMLSGMLASDTLVGGWSGRRVGALGELRSTVRGGRYDALIDAHVARLRDVYKALEYAPNPFFEEPCRGDDATLLRFHDNVAIEWMTATDAAFASLDALLDLAPAGGKHEVVVAFVKLSTAQLRQVTQQDASVEHVPNVELIQRCVADAGQVVMALGGDSPRFHIRTKEPRRVLALILAALPTDLLPMLTIATRPAAIGVFEVLYPLGITTFVLPS